MIRKHLSFANVIACLALFIALGGASYAAVNLPANSVGTPQIQRNAVKTGKISFEAVRAGKLAKNAVPTNRIRNNAVSTNKIGDLQVTTDKIGDLAVGTGKIGDGAVDTGKLADNSVTSSKLAAASVTQEKLAEDSVGTTQLKGVTQVSETSTVTSNGASGGVTATCPAGQEPLSGGFETQSLGADKWLVKRLVRSGNGWRVFGVNESGGNSTIIAFVYCLAAG